MENNDVFALVDELQEELDSSKTALLSKNKSVDPNVFMEIIEDIRDSLHEEFDESREITAERDGIIADAQAQAEEIIRRAKAEAERLVTEDAITRAAQERANTLLENSQHHAEDIRDSANTYALDVFDELESYYKDCIGLVHENKSRLNAKRTGKPIKTEEAAVSVNEEE